MKTNPLRRWSLAFGILLALSTAPCGLSAQEGPAGPGRGGWMGGGGTPPVIGAITAVTGSDLTIRTTEGEVYKVSFSANTRFMKDRQPARSGDLKTGYMV